MATLMGSGNIVSNDIGSIWVVYDITKTAVWCSKSDCPKLLRKVSYDIVKEEEDADGELQSIIQTGVSEEQADSEEYTQRVKRIGSPTIRNHNLGVIAAFTSKKKATDYIEEYFRLNQLNFAGKEYPEIGLTEINLIS